MSKALVNRLWLAAFILVCCVGAIYQAWSIRNWGSRLSPQDPFSEANALREVDGFRAQGLWRNAGLGDATFGPRYPDMGFVVFFHREADGNFTSPMLHEWYPNATPADLEELREHMVSSTGVYTHYPPGPEYLLYLDEAVFGPEPVSRLRLLPLAIGAAATVFYGLSVRRRFGAVAAWIVILASLKAVPFSDAYTELHYLGYALALLLVEIGVAIGRNRLRWPFLLLGFLQGWLSFDYFFLVVLTPLAVELSQPVIEPGYDVRWRLAVERCVVAGAGFALAHLLHLVEVSAYYGSFSGAIADLQDSARWRAVGEQHLKNGWSATVIDNLNHHLFSSDPMFSFTFLRLKLGRLWILVALGFLAVGVARIRSGLSAFNLLGRWALIGLIGLVPSCAWYVMMASHSNEHIYLNYRHLMFCFELWTLFLAVLAAGLIKAWLHEADAQPGMASLGAFAKAPLAAGSTGGLGNV